MPRKAPAVDPKQIKALQPLQPPVPSEKQTLLFQLDALRAETNARQEVHRKADEALRGIKIEAQKVEERLAELRDEAFLEVLTPELVDVLAPEHDRTSCSDDNRCNADRGCTRCKLLEAKHMGYIDFKWSFEVSFHDDY